METESKEVQLFAYSFPEPGTEPQSQLPVAEMEPLGCKLTTCFLKGKGILFAISENANRPSPVSPS